MYGKKKMLYYHISFNILLTKLVVASKNFCVQTKVINSNFINKIIALLAKTKRDIFEENELCC